MREKKNNVMQQITVLLLLFFSVTDKMADDLELEDTCLRDSISIASTDSFVSAAEVRINHRAVNNIDQ